MMIGFGFLGMLLFWGGLVALLRGAPLALREATGTRLTDGQRQPTARQILDERLARGEISREQYEAIRTQLEG